MSDENSSDSQEYKESYYHEEEDDVEEHRDKVPKYEYGFQGEDAEELHYEWVADDEKEEVLEEEEEEEDGETAGKEKGEVKSRVITAPKDMCALTLASRSKGKCALSLNAATRRERECESALIKARS